MNEDTTAEAIDNIMRIIQATTMAHDSALAKLKWELGFTRWLVAMLTVWLIVVTVAVAIA